MKTASLCLMLTSLSAVSSLTFDIAARGSQCLFTDLQKGEYMTADIFVKSGSALSVNVKIDGPLTTLSDATPTILYRLANNAKISSTPGSSPAPAFLHPDYQVHVTELVDMIAITNLDVNTPAGLTHSQASVLSGRRVPKTYNEVEDSNNPIAAEQEGDTYLKTVQAQAAGVYRTCVTNNVGHFKAAVVDITVRQSEKAFRLDYDASSGAALENTGNEAPAAVETEATRPVGWGVALPPQASSGGGDADFLTGGGHVPKFMYGSGARNELPSDGTTTTTTEDKAVAGDAKGVQAAGSDAAAAPSDVSDESPLLTSLKGRIAEIKSTFHDLSLHQERSRHRLDVHMATTESSRSGMVVGSVAETVIFMAVCFLQIWGVKKLFEGRGGNTNAGAGGTTRAWA